MSKNNPRLCALVLLPREQYSRKPQHLQYIVRCHPTTLDEFIVECLRFQHAELQKPRPQLSFLFGWEHSVSPEEPPNGFKDLLRWKGPDSGSFESFLRTHLQSFFVEQAAA